MDKEKLINRLNVVNKEILIYKTNLIEEIEKESIIPATYDLLALRDLKEQQGLLQQLIAESEDK
jgi:hypothetical protein